MLYRSTLACLFSCVLVASALMFITLGLVLFSNKYFILSTDLKPYYIGAEIVRFIGKEKLYDLPTQLIVQHTQITSNPKIIFLPYRYPPFVALLYLPLTWFSFLQSYWIIFCCNLLLLLLITLLLPLLYPHTDQYRARFIIPFIFYPHLVTLLYGQTAILFSLSLIGTMLFLRSQRPRNAAIFFSLLLIKPQYFLLSLPFFLIFTHQKKQLLLFLSMSGSALLVLSLFVTGWQGILHYPRYVLQTETVEYGSSSANMANIYGLLHQYPVVGNPWFLGNVVFFVFLFSVFFFWSFREKFSLVSGLSASVSFLPLLSLHTFDSDLSVLIVPFFYLLHHAWEKKSHTLEFFLACLFLMVINGLRLVSSGNRTMLVLLFAIYVTVIAWQSGKNVGKVA